MAKDYLAEKAQKRKTGQKALWLLIILVVVVVSIIVKITLGDKLKPNVFNGLPTSDEAYTVAKEFIRPTLKSSDADFSDSHYQFAKISDSVYVIKSKVVSSDSKDEKVTLDFKVTLQYKGGEPTRQKNWTLIGIDEN